VTEKAAAPKPVPLRFQGLEARRRAGEFFSSGKYKGQKKADVVRERFREFCEEAARIAIDMEQKTWLDPETGALWDRHTYSRARIGQVLGFRNADQELPSFLEEPHFSRALEWERIRREANIRMSAENIKPLLSVIASGFVLETLSRVLNDPKGISNRELLTEGRKWVQMLVESDAGNAAKPGIQNTITILLQNIQGLPQASRRKVLRLVGGEVERAVETMKQLAQVVDTADKEKERVS